MKRFGVCVAAALLCVVQSATAQGVAGPYLAARQAAAENDFQAAARYYTMALVQDPGNFAHLENAMSAYLAVGNYELAGTLSGQMLERGSNSQIAHMVDVAVSANDGAFSEIVESLGAGTRIGALVDGLVMGWALIGQGELDAGIAQFDVVAANPGVRDFSLYHKALALAASGDLVGAERILSGEAEGPIASTHRGALAHAQILSALGRNSDARRQIAEELGGQLDARFSALDARLSSGTQVAFDVIQRPSHGIAEVFYTISAALDGQANDSYALLYARIAEYLDPRHVDAVLLSADYLEALGRHDLANEAFDRVPQQAPQYISASLGRADALRADGRPDAAVEVLHQLTKAFPSNPRVHIKLGDQLRREERYLEAIAAYDRGLSLYPLPDRGQWFTYFARGIAHERSDQWTQAEADFRKALELNPEQPQVLNYLGYSLVEMNLKLDEALGMIETAVAARPDSGHIMDSLGWVLYKLGRFEDAVAPMETAVELMATDPIINDHLGDVYWAVGRQTEARFQWMRALSFDPDDDSAMRIRRKLEVGLDVVLRDEGTAPIAIAQDG